MSPAFISGIRTEFPEATITYSIKLAIQNIIFGIIFSKNQYTMTLLQDY